MIDCINQNNTPYLSLNVPRNNVWSGYDWSALTGFDYNSANYSTVFRIPDYETLKLDPIYNFSKPIVVVPNERDVNGDMVLPIVGFTYDWQNDQIILVQWATEDDFEDDPFYYVWVTDYKAVSIPIDPTQYSCTGEDAPVENDGFCDGNCGENESNSQNDCDQNFLRKVWIEDLEIKEDFRKKCGNPKYQWLESKANGRYEMGYLALVAHANGKSIMRGGEFEEKWHRKEVLRTRKINPGCNFNQHGTNTYKHGLTARYWWENNNEFYPYSEEAKVNQPKPYLSMNYKPWRDTIYFVIYERDEPNFSHKRTIRIRIDLINHMTFNITHIIMKDHGATLVSG